MKINKEFIILFFIVLLASFLRLYKLDQNPPSPYWEEAALGYDAWSILKTGRDHHGNAFPLSAFTSFGDYKPSLYFYITALMELVFGLTTLAVRLPSAMAGIGTILLTYLLVLKIFGKDRKSKSIALISTFLLAIAPWHILISRVGFETNVSFFLDLLGLYLFISYFEEKLSKLYLIILAFIFWGLSLYTYHSARVFIPLLILFLSLIYFKKILPQKEHFIMSGIIFILLLIPLLLKISSPEIRQRFNETSALATLEPILLSNTAIAQDGGGKIAKLVHHRFGYYSQILAENYLSHFNFKFLFVEGDANLRHSVGLIGQLYWIYAPFLFLGLFYYFYNQERKLNPIIIFTLLAPIPAALTTGTPHALRSLPMVLGLSIFAGYGLFNFWEKWRLKKVLRNILLILLILIINFHLIQFWYYYWHEYRLVAEDQWQYGYEDLMQYLNKVSQDFDIILVTRDFGRPAMYYWFFNQIDPNLVQSWDSIAPKDQGEYLQFENIYFGIKPQTTGKLLQVEVDPLAQQVATKIIYNLKNEPVFYLYEI